MSLEPHINLSTFVNRTNRTQPVFYAARQGVLCLQGTALLASFKLPTTLETLHLRIPSSFQVLASSDVS